MTDGNERYFSKAQRNLGIHSVRGHFIQLEKRLFAVQEAQSPDRLDLNVIERTLHDDSIFDHLVVQRHRSYVKESQQQLEGSQVLFPERGAPQVVPYRLKLTYGRLLDSVEKAFSKESPLFVLRGSIRHWPTGKAARKIRNTLTSRRPAGSGRADSHAVSQAIREFCPCF